MPDDERRDLAAARARRARPKSAGCPRTPPGAATPAGSRCEKGAAAVPAGARTDAGGGGGSTRTAISRTGTDPRHEGRRCRRGGGRGRGRAGWSAWAPTPAISRQAVELVRDGRDRRSERPSSRDFGRGHRRASSPRRVPGRRAEVRNRSSKPPRSTAPGVVAVGECGLDYHYEHSPRPAQLEAFAAQVALAVARPDPGRAHARRVGRHARRPATARAHPSARCCTASPADRKKRGGASISAPSCRSVASSRSKVRRTCATRPACVRSTGSWSRPTRRSWRRYRTAGSRIVRHGWWPSANAMALLKGVTPAELAETTTSPRAPPSPSLNHARHVDHTPQE